MYASLDIDMVLLWWWNFFTKSTYNYSRFFNQKFGMASNPDDFQLLDFLGATFTSWVLVSFQMCVSVS